MGNREATMQTVQVKTVSVGKTEMDYVIFGSGEKNFVILPGLSVHSVMGAADAIADAYKMFCKEYTVYVFDRVKNIRDGYTVRNMAEDTAAATKTLNIGCADIFGASQGGMIAMCLAAAFPDMVHKLILGSTLAESNATFSSVLEEWIRLAENREEAGLINSFVSSVYSEKTLAAYCKELIASNAGISEDEFYRFLLLAKACRHIDCRRELSAIRCPVLVLGAEGDRVATGEGSRQISETLGCEIYLYGKDYGHGVYDEAPDYRQRCIKFLADSIDC